MGFSFRQLSADHPALDHSKMLNAFCKTIDHAAEHGGIGLTKSNAFNRKFCHWAATNFDWPEYSAYELYRLNKVLNEEDVQPVEAIHEAAIFMKLGRYTKGTWRFNKAAAELRDDGGKFLRELFRIWVLQFPHYMMTRMAQPCPANWGVFINVIDIETDKGLIDKHLLKILYGYELKGAGSLEYWQHSSSVTNCILKPLTWLGLLDKSDGPERFQHTYHKTDLWRAALMTDRDLMAMPVAANDQ